MTIPYRVVNRVCSGPGEPGKPGKYTIRKKPGKKQENQEKTQSAGKNEKHDQEKSNLKKLLIETPKIS